MEFCVEEITTRIARVAWLEQVKADELKDRNIWRSGLVPHPVWRRMMKKHAATRKGNNLRWLDVSLLIQTEKIFDLYICNTF